MNIPNNTGLLPRTESGPRFSMLRSDSTLCPFLKLRKLPTPPGSLKSGHSERVQARSRLFCGPISSYPKQKTTDHLES
jgi:hypothetical protein